MIGIEWYKKIMLQMGVSISGYTEYLLSSLKMSPLSLITKLRCIIRSSSSVVSDPRGFLRRYYGDPRRRLNC